MHKIEDQFQWLYGHRPCMTARASFVVKTAGLRLVPNAIVLTRMQCKGGRRATRNSADEIVYLGVRSCNGALTIRYHSPQLDSLCSPSYVSYLSKPNHISVHDCIPDDFYIYEFRTKNRHMKITKPSLELDELSRHSYFYHKTN